MSKEESSKKTYKRQKIQENKCLKINIDDDRRCFERMAKLIDNRHDFKPAGRNQSIDNTMVLRILNDFKVELTKQKLQNKSYETIYKELLKIHCSDYTSSCEKTTINIDKDAEHQFEKYFNQTLDLSSIPTVSWEKFSKDISLTNHLHVMIGDKKQLYRLLPTKEKPQNIFLKTLMGRIIPYLGKQYENQINFVIDTCALSELAFTTAIENKKEEKEAQLNIDIAKNHSRIYIGNGTDLDIFNKAVPTTGSTRFEINYCADTDIGENTNHLILNTMNTIDYSPHWSWNSKHGSGKIKFDRDQEKTRFGVEKFSMLILNAMNTRSKDKELLEEFKNLTGIDHDHKEISVVNYGKHVFDIKRLMDTSQIMYAWTLNQLAKDPQHPQHPLYGKEFIFITIDYMASCIARLLGVSVIYTNRNPHTKKYSFTIHLNKDLNREEKTLLIQKQEIENKHRYDLFREQLSKIPKEEPINVPELHPFDFNYQSKSKTETRIEQSGEMIFNHLIKLFERYLIQCLNLIQFYKKLIITDSYNESYRLQNHIFMESHLAEEYQQLKRIYHHYTIHETELNDPSIHIKKRIQTFVTQFERYLTGLSYFKFTPLLHLIQSFNHGERNLEYPIYLILASTGRGRNLETILYKSHPSAIRSEVYGFDKWINAFVYFQDLIFNEWCVPTEKTDTSLNFKTPEISEEIYKDLKSLSQQKPVNIFFKKTLRNGGGPSGNSDSQTPTFIPATQDQPIYDFLAPGSPSKDEYESPIKQTKIQETIKQHLQTQKIYNELNCRYGDIPYETLKDFNDFKKYLDQCEKADLVKMLGLSMINKQEKRLEYEHIVHPNRETFLQELDKPMRRATIGGSKFLNDYMKHLSLLSNP